jgi:GAF domain-containing protein
MISMSSENPTWRLGEEDLTLLNQIGLQTANAIDIARSFEVAAKRADREKMMVGITSRMRETLDVEMVLQTAVNEIYRAFNLEAVAGYLVADQPEVSVVSDTAPPDLQQQQGEEARS